jgi:hypothetical protein
LHQAGIRESIEEKSHGESGSQWFGIDQDEEQPVGTHQRT